MVEFRVLSPWDATWSRIARSIRLGTVGLFLVFGGVDLIREIATGAGTPWQQLWLVLLGVFFLYASHAASHGLYMLAHATALLVANWPLQGPSFRTQRGTTASITAISRLGIFLRQFRALRVQYSIIGIVLYFVLDDFHLLFIAFKWVAFSFWDWVRTSPPPAVVVLAQSGDRAASLQWKVRAAVEPSRVVSLLGFGAPDEGEDPPAQLALDCLRTSNDDDWWLAVTRLLEMVPIIVVDGRAGEGTRSDALDREIAFLLEQDLMRKTLFVGAAPGSAAVLHHASTEARAAAAIGDERMVLSVLRRVFSPRGRARVHWPEVDVREHLPGAWARG